MQLLLIDLIGGKLVNDLKKIGKPKIKKKYPEYVLPQTVDLCKFEEMADPNYIHYIALQTFITILSLCILAGYSITLSRSFTFTFYYLGY